MAVGVGGAHGEAGSSSWSMPTMNSSVCGGLRSRSTLSGVEPDRGGVGGVDPDAAEEVAEDDLAGLDQPVAVRVVPAVGQVARGDRVLVLHP